MREFDYGLLVRVDHVVQHERDIMCLQVMRNDVDLLEAHAQFVDGHTVRLDPVGRTGARDVTAGRIIIAVGTSVTRGEHIPFDGQTIMTSDDVCGLNRLPRTLAVVGGGVVGCE